MDTVVELLRSAGFQYEGTPTATRRTFLKPGTAYQATVGERRLRLMRVDGLRVEDVHLVASIDHEDIGAVVTALRATERPS